MSADTVRSDVRVGPGRVFFVPAPMLHDFDPVGPIVKACDCNNAEAVHEWGSAAFCLVTLGAKVGYYGATDPPSRRARITGEPDRMLIDKTVAAHPFIEHADGVRCDSCTDRPAAHKVGEEINLPPFHNLTAYLCCACFKRAVGDCGKWPYALGRLPEDLAANR